MAQVEDEPPLAGAPDSKGRIQAPWSRSDRPLPRLVVRPLQGFLQTEASGGILLLVATGAALVWANSPFREAYESLWHTEATLWLGPWVISEELREWVNEGLMALFFFVVGLEIKRELTTGELRSRRAAALPAIAAIGGMVVPALLYLALNRGGEAARGWGIPMATDIAFAVGVLTIVARRLPGTLKSFLLTLAIVDDIGAIAVIAVFYPGQIAWGALGVAGGLLALIVMLERLHVRASVLYVILGVATWIATHESGVHATIAGVALGFLTPSRPFQRPRAVSEEAHRVAEQTVDDPSPPDSDAHHWLWLASLSREAVSPLARLEHLLHPWTSYVVIPVFALANAGVVLSGSSIGAAGTSSVALGVLVGLVGGKTIGITLATWIGTRLGLAGLPRGARWDHVLGVGLLAGIGFTVSLFITDLAFVDPTRVQDAKIGILAASAVAGIGGSAVLLRSARTRSREGRPDRPAGQPPA